MRTALHAVTDALLPRGDGVDLCDDADVTAGVAALLTQLSRPVRAVLRGYLLIIEYCLPGVYGRPARFSRLSRADRLAILRRCLRSRSPLVRDLTRVLNALVAVRFYDDPAVHAHLGYPIGAHVRRVNSIDGRTP